MSHPQIQQTFSSNETGIKTSLQDGYKSNFLLRQGDIMQVQLQALGDELRTL